MDFSERFIEMKDASKAVALGASLLNFNAVSLVIETDEDVLRDLELPDEILEEVLDSMDSLIKVIHDANESINPTIKHIRELLNMAGIEE